MKKTMWRLMRLNLKVIGRWSKVPNTFDYADRHEAHRELDRIEKADRSGNWKYAVEIV